MTVPTQHLKSDVPLAVDSNAADATIRINGHTDMRNCLVRVAELTLGTFKDVLGIGRHASAGNQGEPFCVVAVLWVVAPFQHGTFGKVSTEMLGVDNDAYHTVAGFFAKFDDGPIRKRNVQQGAASLSYQNSRTIGVSCRFPAL